MISSKMMQSSCQAAATTTRNMAVRFSRMRSATTTAPAAISSNPLVHSRRTIMTVARYGRISRPTSSLGSSSIGSLQLQDPQLALLAQPQHHQQQQIRSIFIQTAETPNPESLKFIPTGVDVLGYPDENDEDDNTPSGYYVTRNDNQADILRSPLAKKLLDLDGVKAVYLGPDFVTVTKYAENKWKLLRPSLFEILMDWADNDTKMPALLDHPIVTDTTILDDDDEVVAMIKELIEARIRPAVQEDGGDIRYVGFDEESGLVTVQLAGSCVGCPSSAVTLKQGVENMLMHYIPEVTAVEALEEEEEDEVGGGASSNVKGNDDDGDDDEPVDEASKKQKSYQERLAQAGIPFSD